VTELREGRASLEDFPLFLSCYIFYYYFSFKVIFLIGEIDCREGLLVAVERDRYASLVEGMERTVDIFLAAIVKIIAAKKFNVRDCRCEHSCCRLLERSLRFMFPTSQICAIEWCSRCSNSPFLSLPAGVRPSDSPCAQ
jgi:hypothetical protein